MELPITIPSRVSYGDEVDFKELLGSLAETKHNGFIRVTHDSDEGYILFNEGVQVASSYGRYMKEEALNKILEVVDKSETLIEVFDLKKSQLEYLMDINKIYSIENPHQLSTEKDETNINLKQKPYIKPRKTRSETKVADAKPSTEVSENPESGKVSPSGMANPTSSVSEGEIAAETTSGSAISGGSSEGVLNTESQPEEEKPEKPLNRAELMKKYGLRDIDDEEVEKVLESYKGGAITDIDPERVELTLMNKIKMSLLSLPKIKGAEVIVFLDNSFELSGKIKIMVEYEGKGIFSRIRGESKVSEQLRLQIMDIVEMELRKTFRDFPEIVDQFEVGIEIR